LLLGPLVYQAAYIILAHKHGPTVFSLRAQLFLRTRAMSPVTGRELNDVSTPPPPKKFRVLSKPQCTDKLCGLLPNR